MEGVRAARGGLFEDAVLTEAVGRRRGIAEVSHDEACLSAASSCGGSPAVEIASIAASRAGTVASALPRAFLRGLGPSSGAVADGPALTGPSWSTSVSASAGVRRSVRERRANWSGKGCQVPRSTKTVVPVARETPCSGSAIKLPNLKPPLALIGWKS
ncbi:hypothetical protein OK074_5119 [Actinobacteria bacterium OK074]|nr:hypothetical protein OK074_5119 [Actinobacteria bacterium OK074]